MVGHGESGYCDLLARESLINDVLDSAKIEAGKLDGTREKIDLRVVIEDVAASMRLLSEKKNLQFLVTAPKEPVFLSINRRVLSQILINLTINAIKYTKRGTVHFWVERHRSAGDATVAVAVEDTGRGIQSEGEKNPFEECSRIGAVDQNNQFGSRVGLHTSGKLAAVLGGGITFNSDYGGSTFSLELREK